MFNKSREKNSAELFADRINGNVQLKEGRQLKKKSGHRQRTTEMQRREGAEGGDWSNSCFQVSLFVRWFVEANSHIYVFLDGYPQ